MNTVVLRSQCRILSCIHILCPCMYITVERSATSTANHQMLSPEGALAGAAAGRQVNDMAPGDMTTFDTTEEKWLPQPARPPVTKQPTWQLDRSVTSSTAAWRPSPTSQQQEREEASISAANSVRGLLHGVL